MFSWHMMEICCFAAVPYDAGFVLDLCFRDLKNS